MSTRYKGMVATGVWIPEKLLNLAKKNEHNFNLSHYLTQQLQNDFDSIESKVDNFLLKLGSSK